MKIPGYSHWLTVFRPLSWLVPLAEQMYDVAGIFLAADTPLPDETVRLLQRMVGELGEQTDLLRALTSQTSAPPVAHSRSPEDAAGGPPPTTADSVSGGGHPKTEDIVDEYWDEDTRDLIRKTVTRHIGNTFGTGDEIADDIYSDLSQSAPDMLNEAARLRRELDAARQERDNANARANAGRLAP